MFNRLSGATVATSSGKEPLVTITADDIAEMGAEGEPQQGRIPYQELKQVGIYRVPRAKNDKFGFTELADFVADPEANPTKTTSGKLEIYNQELSDWVKANGFNLKDPLPKYDPPIEGYEDTFADWDNKVKGDYPLQLFTLHYQRRSHSSFDNVPWLREAFPQESMMNPIDAKARGIENGDSVLITSQHGKVLRPAFVTDRIMPGVVMLGEGAWAEVDEETGIDMAGATNTLNGDIPTGQGHTGHNTCVVEVTKYEGDLNLERDHKWPQRIILKEA
jgi:anaerobic dimethyl sulfoxide reductase subunit A